MIGYSLLADKPLDTGNGSLVPTDASFIISAHKDKDGNPSKQYDLYTLNYLLMTMGMPMPTPRAFSWNWIDSNKITGGIIAINRGVFALYLRNQLKDSLKEVIKQPRLTLTGHMDRINIAHEFVNEPDQPELSLPGQFLPLETTRCEYYKEAKASTTITLLHDLHQLKAIMGYNPAIMIKFNDTELQFNYALRTFYNIAIAEEVRGVMLFCVKAIERSYTLGVNSRGELSLTLKATTDNSGDFPPFPAQKLGWFRGISAQLRNELIISKATMLKAENKKMLELINHGINWVFPGTDSFTFSNCYFSAKEDLITEINYAAIS
jgi:hypothetical protein